MAGKKLSPKAILATAAGGAVIILLASAAVVLLGGRQPAEPGPSASRSTPSTPSVVASQSIEPSGFPTPEEAAAAAVPAGHILEVAEESQNLQLFWAGPPASEWDTFVTVEKSEGLWRVTKIEPWSIDEAENGSASAEDAPSSAGAGEAESLIEQFLEAIRQDRPRDAQKLTIAPLHEDPASTQVSNGEFTSYTIDDVQPRGGGRFWVLTTETWTYGIENWRYDVVSTRSGLRIRNIEPAE